MKNKIKVYLILPLIDKKIACVSGLDWPISKSMGTIFGGCCFVF